MRAIHLLHRQNISSIQDGEALVPEMGSLVSQTAAIDLLGNVYVADQLGLQPGDVDFNGQFIEVKRSIVKGRVETPKNGKSRRVDMSGLLAEVLKDQLTRTKEETLKKGWQKLPETLFYNEQGRHLDPHNLLKRYFYKSLEKAGLRRVRFHDLRHTFASIHISQDESLAYVSDSAWAS